MATAISDIRVGEELDEPRKLPDGTEVTHQDKVIPAGSEVAQSDFSDEEWAALVQSGAVAETPEDVLRAEQSALLTQSTSALLQGPAKNPPDAVDEKSAQAQDPQPDPNRPDPDRVPEPEPEKPAAAATRSAPAAKEGAGSE